MRNTEFYQSLDTYKACEYAEGFGSGENATPEEQLIAWQYISDHEIYRFLQGFYGRSVRQLLDDGLILPPE